MNMPTDTPRCSKCKSINVERVDRVVEAGFRCRRCGHEHMKPDPNFREDKGSTVWTKETTHYHDF